MLSLSAKIRKNLGKKVKTIRRQGALPAILYGSKIKSLPLEVDLEEFENIYKAVGESGLIKLQIKPSSRAQVEGDKKIKTKEFSILIHDVQRDPLTGKLIHVDFFQPSLKEEVEVTVPLVFEGLSKAVKDLGGTLVKNISEVEVKALPQNLPKEIKVNIESLKTFEDEILIKDLLVPEGIEVLKKPDEVIAKVSPPEKVEEELEKPIEEKVEEVEKVEEKEEKEKKKEETKRGSK